LRAALQQATVARDEAQEELERLRKKATSLEDEHHFLQTDFSAKSTDMLEKFSAQVPFSLFGAATNLRSYTGQKWPD
jgi:chromosome segregation ATPase